MTTPDDTTRTAETTNHSTNDTTTDRTTTETTATDPTSTDDTSPLTIPGSTPITEEAGAPLVPTTTTGQADTTPLEGRFESTRGRTPPPADDERDAPLVPDLRATRSPRTDGGSR